MVLGRRTVTQDAQMHLHLLLALNNNFQLAA
jgi:hypothetical protein